MYIKVAYENIETTVRYALSRFNILSTEQIEVMLKDRIGIVAYNIHQGGGKTVLRAFLKEKQALNNSLICYIDQRLELDFENFPKIEFIKIKPTFGSRFKAEVLINKQSYEFKTTYFLGNLPPIFPPHSPSRLFLQNRLLISRNCFSLSQLKTSIRVLIEKVWFNVFLKNIDIVEVQTPSMLNALRKNYKDLSIEVHNYIDIEEIHNLKTRFENEGIAKVKNSFICITSEEKHKNLHNLIDAFCRLNSTGKQYSLSMTINEKSSTNAYAAQRGVKINCLASLARKDILLNLYQSDYLIFPSILESLGLPLVEAKIMGVKIIASNLDFVFDSCDPIITFSPLDSESIFLALNNSLPD